MFIESNSVLGVWYRSVCETKMPAIGRLHLVGKRIEIYTTVKKKISKLHIMLEVGKAVKTGWEWGAVVILNRWSA